MRGEHVTSAKVANTRSEVHDREQGDLRRKKGREGRTVCMHVVLFSFVCMLHSPRVSQQQRQKRNIQTPKAEEWKKGIRKGQSFIDY